MKTFICIDSNNQTCGVGNTLTEAYDDFTNIHEDMSVDELEFYELNDEIKVERMVVPKTVLVKSK